MRQSVSSRRRVDRVSGSHVRRKKPKIGELSRRARKSNFGAGASLSGQQDGAELSNSVLGELRKHKHLRRKHHVSDDEMQMLSQFVKFGCHLGKVHSLRDLI